MKSVIHINQRVIRRNRKTGSNDPVVTCKTYKDNRYGSTVIIRDKAGNEVARIVYRPEKPLSCGAVAWVETENQVEVF